MSNDLEAKIKHLAETLAEARVDALTSATTTILTTLIDALVKSGALSRAEAIAIPARIQIEAAGKTGPYGETLNLMTLGIQNALIDESVRKPS